LFGFDDVKREVERLGVFVVKDDSFSDELSVSVVSVGKVMVVEVLGHERLQLRGQQGNGSFEEDSENSFLAGGLRFRAHVEVEALVKEVSGASIDNLVKVRSLFKFFTVSRFNFPVEGLQLFDEFAFKGISVINKHERSNSSNSRLTNVVNKHFSNEFSGSIFVFNAMFSVKFESDFVGSQIIGGSGVVLEGNGNASEVSKNFNFFSVVSSLGGNVG